jgi:hypothetical protein
MLVCVVRGAPPGAGAREVDKNELNLNKIK